jgi:hypothetical protein
MQRFWQWFLLDFGFRGGGFLIAATFLLLASILHGRPRLILCIVSWLMVLAQSWWMFMLLAVSSHSNHYTGEMETPFLAATITALTITAGWSFLLLRKRGTLPKDARAA